ncbi:MAG: hypothetical protein AAGC57_13455 [Pseudomonadota bacterium]
MRHFGTDISGRAIFTAADTLMLRGRFVRHEGETGTEATDHHLVRGLLAGCGA